MAGVWQKLGNRLAGGHRLRLAALGVAITLAMAALYVTEPPIITGFFNALEARLLDLRFALRGPKPPKAPVVVAALDEKSLKEIGRWPWPRPVLARLVRALGGSGAAVVGLDMGFFDTESSLALRLAREELAAAGPDQRAGLERLVRRLSGDDLLADALMGSRCPLVVGYFFHMGSADVGFLDQAERQRLRRMVASSRYKFIYLPKGVDEAALPVPDAFAPQPNLPRINQAAQALGYFNTLPDVDGTVRRLPMVVRMARGPKPADGFDYFVPLSLAMLRMRMGGELWAQGRELARARRGLAAAARAGRVSPQQAAEVRAQLDAAGEEISGLWSGFEPRLQLGTAGVRQVQVGRIKADTGPSGGLQLNFRGPAHSFPYYSWSDILNGRLAPDALAGKLVVVGASAVGVGDVKPTPFDPLLPGPELQATALDNLLSGDWLERPDWARGVDLFIILGLGLLASLIMPAVSAPAGLVIYFLLAGGFVWFNHFFAFEQKRWVLSAVFPLLTFSAVFLWIAAGRFIMEERERRKTRRAFSYYLSEQVIAQVLENPDMLKLGGQRRELSILFSDLESFTSLSEGLEPEQLTSLLNEFLSEMTDVVLEEQGTLDKYEGDAIVAFWNAPLDQPDHALRACRAALRCQQRLAELQPRFMALAGRELRMRVGVNTGTVVVGNMGSKKRFDYTFMGDAGNLASRLEGANKYFGTYIMVSEETWRRTDGALTGRELGDVVVLGKTEPVRVFEPTGMAGEAPAPAPEPATGDGDFDRGLRCCRLGQWPEALEAFCSLPDDPAARAYANRCRDICEGDGEDWDAIWNLTSK